MKLKRFQVGLILVFIALLSTVTEARFKHEEFDTFLKQYVHNGHVNYKAMLKGRYPLDHYIKLLGKYPAKTLSKESRNNQMAFYINAYNAITIKIILDNYPPVDSGMFSSGKFKSIKNITGVWNKIKTRVGGAMLTLDEIEHDILRAKFNRPSVHFVLVCASVSCPKLQSYAFSGKKLKRQLDDCAREFLNDKKRNKFCKNCNTIVLSKIFKWYGNDFTRKYGVNSTLNKKYGKKLGAVLHFAGKYIPKEYSESLQSTDKNIEFLDYNWGLNE